MIHSVGSQEAQSESWFVIWTQSRAQKKVEARMSRSRAFDLAPNNHGTAPLERPLAGGLLPAVSRLPVCAGPLSRMAHGPAHTWSFDGGKAGGGSALIADGFVTKLRDAIERDGTAPEPVVELVACRPGDEVIVQDDPLKGMRGVVCERWSGRQLLIWVSAGLRSRSGRRW